MTFEELEQLNSMATRIKVLTKAIETHHSHLCITLEERKNYPDKALINDRSTAIDVGLRLNRYQEEALLVTLLQILEMERDELADEFSKKGDGK